MMMSGKRKLSEQLRAAIMNAPISRYAISRQTEIPEAVLSRFVHGKSGLSVESIDKIGELLGLSLAASRPAKGRKAKGK
jgi:hypothetical protein